MKNNLIWYEKHRPTKLSQLVLDSKYKKTFKKYIKQKDIPHLMFYGPPGTGKTTLANILINNCSGRNLILNASSEHRGIETIKTKVKNFASVKRLNSKKNIIFFDESNGLTFDAQEALKNLIEKYNENCRFIFSTNEFDKMADAIVSRCQLFKFELLPKELMQEKIEEILELEKVKFKPKELQKIIDIFYPDFRSIINHVQLCVSKNKLFISRISNSTLDTDKIGRLIKKGDLFNIRKQLAGTTDFLWLYKYLFNEFIQNNIKKKDQANAAIVVAEYLYRNNTIIDKEINMAACLIELMGFFDVNINFG